MVEDCCVIREEPGRKRGVACPECGNPAIRVALGPVKHLVWDSSLVTGETFYLCETRGCETVYFDENGGRILRSNLRVRVGAKEVQAPHLVCYCFNHTEEAIEAELRIHGKTTIPDRIRAEISAGTCECEIKNPRGKCCLGRIMNTIAALASRDLTTPKDCSTYFARLLDENQVQKAFYRWASGK